MYLKTFFSRKFFRLNAHFFDDVCIKDKKLKNHIKSWMFNLKYYKDISINKFSDLFSKFEGIAFPITIYGIANHLNIIDALGEHYSLCYYTDYYKLTEYTIKTAAYPLGPKIVCHLTQNNEIILHEKLIHFPKEDNTNGDKIISFNYDEQVTTAVLKIATSILKITYPSFAFQLNDMQFANFLLGLACNFGYIDDVFFVLQIVSNLIKTSKNEQSLTILSYTNNGKELLSEIRVSNGIVTKYSFTTRPSDSEICLHKHTLSEELENFILSHKN